MAVFYRTGDVANIPLRQDNVRAYNFLIIKTSRHVGYLVSFFHHKYEDAAFFVRSKVNIYRRKLFFEEMQSTSKSCHVCRGLSSSKQEVIILRRRRYSSLV